MKFYADGNIPVIPNMYFVYGDGGTGKTSVAKQFVGHKLLFSFDMSSNVLIGDKDVDVIMFEHRDMPNIQAMVEQYIMQGIQDAKYQVIVLDNITALQNLVLENIDDAAKDNRQNYQRLQLWFRDLGTILKESGKTVYATAHQLDNGSSSLSGEGRYQADMNEKTFNAFTSMFDLVGRIYLAGGERMIDLDPEKGNHTKNRIDSRKLIKANELIQSEKGEK